MASRSVSEDPVILRHQIEKDVMLVTNERQSIHILLEILPTEMMAQLRMPLNFALVVDHSHSMKGAKLQNVKEAIKGMLGCLEPTDHISLVLFDYTSQVLISSTPVDNPVNLKALVDRMSVRESNTAQRFMARGMIDGLNELRRWRNPQAINRMILLTDGVTTGDGELCRQLAREAGSEGFAIYPLGIGSDWDEDLLDNIGNLSGGMPAEFIRNPTDALSLFQEQIRGVVDIAACNATLILRLPTGVSPKKAVKVLPMISDIGPNVLSDRHMVIPLGDLEKDKQQSVLCELIIDPRQAGLFRIAQAELNYNVPALGLVNEKIKDDITMMMTADIHSQMQINAYVKNLAKKADAHRLFKPYDL